jgi:hypothetical protein
MTRSGTVSGPGTTGPPSAAVSLLNILDPSSLMPVRKGDFNRLLREVIVFKIMTRDNTPPTNRADRAAAQNVP